MKRAIAKITVYVYGETEEDFLKEAKHIEQVLNYGPEVLTEPHAKLESLTTAPSGTIDPMNHCEIDISKIELKQSKDHYDFSRLNYLRKLNSGESHLGYYKDKYPEHYKKLMDAYQL